MTSLRSILLLVVFLLHANQQHLPLAAAMVANQTVLLFNQNDQIVPAPINVTTPVEREPRSSKPTCRLLAKNPYLHGKLKKLAADGVTHLVVYKFEMEGVEQPVVDPLRVVETNKTSSEVIYFQPMIGYRVLNHGGKLLLHLPQDYDTLSLGLLNVGVLHLKVDLVDRPSDCFQSLSTYTGERSAAILDLMIRDLAGQYMKPASSSDYEDIDEGRRLWSNSEEAICRQIIEPTEDGVAKFSVECCSRIIPTDNRLRCSLLSREVAVDVLHYIPVAAKILFMLVGPVVLLHLFYRRSSGRCDYVVPLPRDGLCKTILVKKICAPVPAEPSTSAGSNEVKQFARFRELVKFLPSEEIAQIKFKQMDITVDRSELISETEYPMESLFHSLYRQLIDCAAIRRYPPTAGCVDSNCIFGSRSSKFLWIRLAGRRGSPTPDCCRGCQWLLLARLIGWIVMICFVIPLPYLARLVLYYSSSESAAATDDKWNATEEIGLDHISLDDPVRWLSPVHPAFIGGLYVTYLSAAILVTIIRLSRPALLETIVTRCVEDFRRTRPQACLSLLIAHLLLPIEKFGIILGLVVGAFVWPVVLPVCLVITLCYAVPTINVIGRLLIGRRPACFYLFPVRSPERTEAIESLSEGVSSLESCCFLNSISPSENYYNRGEHPAATAAGAAATSHKKSDRKSAASAAASQKRTKRQKSARRRQKLTDGITNVLVGLVLTVLLLAVLIMYAESFGFVVEMVTLTAIGAVLSSGSGSSSTAVLYFILGVWSLVYFIGIYHVVVVSCYKRFMRALFAGLRRHLAAELAAYQDANHNMAFKLSGSRSSEMPSVTAEERRTQGGRGSRAASVDSIEYQKDNLHWKVQSLVLFVDRATDAMKMPRALFHQLCQLNVVGSPCGIRVFLVAAGWLIGAFVYLSLVCLAVRLSSGTHSTSFPASQSLATMLLGAVPIALYAVVARFRSSAVEVATDFSLSGQIQQVVSRYTRVWPAHDLLFVQETRAAGSNGFGSDIVDPSQVDLLITIRDDAAANAAAGEQPSTSAAALEAGPRAVSDTVGNESFHATTSQLENAAYSAPMFGRVRPASVPAVSALPAVSNSVDADALTPTRRSGLAGRCAAEAKVVPGSVTAKGQASMTPPGLDDVDAVPTKYVRDREHVTASFSLRKQSSVSTLMVRNGGGGGGGSDGVDNNRVHGDTAMAALTASQSVLVVDLLSEENLTASLVKYPEAGYNKTPIATGNGPRSAESTRSLPSCKGADVTDGSQQESSL